MLRYKGLCFSDSLVLENLINESIHKFTMKIPAHAIKRPFDFYIDTGYSVWQKDARDLVEILRDQKVTLDLVGEIHLRPARPITSRSVYDMGVSSPLDSTLKVHVPYSSDLREGFERIAIELKGDHFYLELQDDKSVLNEIGTNYEKRSDEGIMGRGHVTCPFKDRKKMIGTIVHIVEDFYTS